MIGLSAFDSRRFRRTQKPLSSRRDAEQNRGRDSPTMSPELTQSHRSQDNHHRAAMCSLHPRLLFETHTSYAATRALWPAGRGRTGATYSAHTLHARAPDGWTQSVFRAVLPAVRTVHLMEQRAVPRSSGSLGKRQDGPTRR